MKNFIFGFLITMVVVVVVGFSAYFLGFRQVKKGALSSEPSPTVIPVQVNEETPLVGSDRDSHGCIGSAGYQWCEVKQKCLRSWEEACVLADSNDVEEIKQALIKKNNWTNMELELTIAKNDGRYASGGVTEKGSQAGGGMFFAIKDNGVWKIVADGNGIISCSSLESYPDYPKDIIPQCFDEQTQQLVQR